MKLLTTNNAKLLKSEQFGYRSLGLSLAPNTMNSKGINICGKNSESCTKSCLLYSGLNSLSINSKIKKTDLFLSNRTEFLKRLIVEIQYEEMLAKLDNLKLTMRLNMYSDLDWSKLKYEKKNIYEWCPNVEFIEYTRYWNRFSKYSNLHYTYSADRTLVTDLDIVKKCKKGFNVSMVFLKNIPKEWNGIEVIDGDLSDLRHLDKKGVIIGLRWKNAIIKGVSNKSLQKDNSFLY